MQHAEGSLGRAFVLRFDHGEDVLGSLTQFVRDHHVRGGIVWLVGALTSGRVVTGPEELELPPTPHWVEFDDGREIVGLGTIFWCGDEPKIHLHGSFGRGRDALTGCLREMSETFLVIEGVLLEITGTGAKRVFDDASQLALLDLTAGEP